MVFTTGKKLLAAVLVSAGMLAGAQAADYARHPLALELMAEMRDEFGFTEERLQQVFALAHKQQGILDAISRPAERVKPWKEYRPIFLTRQRIDKGLQFWAENEEALARAEKEYGVPAEFIVAIIGVETFYGGNTGRYSVLDALSTLAFDYPPRAPFFRGQLKQFLLLTREEQLEPASLKGSYAGAMGLPQFMPGSFRAYAVDFNGDGRINIWTDAEDAIGSVANYFIEHGWQPGQKVAVPATLKNEQAEQGLTGGLDPKHSMKELKALGWQAQQKVAGKTRVTAFRFDGESGVEYWLGLPNFQAITRYNRSEMYAMAVTQLAETLASEFKETR
ncbi:lytic murein transglycosylase B [Thiopseudomonas denitrificans]|uniref:Membrane-bound lytic murein transglycosylase B n=1 Tax=Thiopseudomonas denitrificans TaxID=1501432 RepID=A0A4R6TU65_9GAMM|nr:lytic murein transglycosylase B [Thiopseudomonas denitrificans]TDQ36666.1 membrane-bound lytic murein transglycosylase B [Thiopseudomonas denitrificans]